MRSAILAVALAVACLLGGARRLDAADEATAFRLFLKDGQSLVSYGEYARVGDRIVFSLPTAATPNPPLHLVNLAADEVDWPRTERYAESARAARYVATQAEADYTELTNAVAQTLNDVTFTSDPARRLAIVEQARKTLADWPSAHFNFRREDVRQMLAIVDEAIADLRVATGGGRFTLNLVAETDLLPTAERLLPLPTPKEAIEQTLLAARLTDVSAERTSLLSTVLVELDRDAASLPADWLAATRRHTRRTLDAELRTDREYQELANSLLEMAARRARDADVRGLEQLLVRAHQRDAALGGKRKEAVNGLIAAVEADLDAARRLRLARDHWALRVPDFNKYADAISRPVDLFGRLQPALAEIKSLAGSTPEHLAAVQRTTKQIASLVSSIVPPDEFRGAHALLVSAAQLADSAARIRREATLSSDMARAWDASSAAAGALLLAARAKRDIQVLLRPPQLK